MGCQLIKQEWWKHSFRFSLVFHSPPFFYSVFMYWSEAHSSPLPIFCSVQQKNLGETHVTLMFNLPTSDLYLIFKTVETVGVWHKRFRECPDRTFSRQHQNSSRLTTELRWGQTQTWQIITSPSPFVCLSFNVNRNITNNLIISTITQDAAWKPNLALVFIIHWLGCLLTHLDPGCTKALKALCSVRSHEWPNSSTFTCVSGHLSMFTSVRLIHMYFMNEDMQKSVSELKLWPGMRNILSNVL